MKSEKSLLKFKKGDIIYKSGGECGKTGNSVYLIKSGAVCMTYEYKSNSLIVVLEKDEMFGAEEVFCSKHRIFNIIVLSDLEVEAWSLENFIVEINLSINIAREAIVQLIKKLRVINSRKKFSYENTDCNTSPVAIESQTSLPDDDVAESIYNFAFYDREPESIVNIYKHIGAAYKKGDIIIEENANDNCAYLIISGTLKIYHIFAGKSEILGSAGPGDFVGEMNLFHTTKRSATVEVESDTCKALKFNKDSFDMLFQLHPKWGIKLLENLSKKIVCVMKKLY